MTDLYRIYNGSFDLLYVGIADDVLKRMAWHRKYQRWWPDVATINFEDAGRRRFALQREREVIRTELPEYNIVHRPTSDELLDIIKMWCPAMSDYWQEVAEYPHLLSDEGLPYCRDRHELKILDDIDVILRRYSSVWRGAVSERARENCVFYAKLEMNQFCFGGDCITPAWAQPRVECPF